jgi:hypothetical protein
MTKETYAAPMSFVGATKRILNWASGSIVKKILGWISLPFVWIFLILWYIVVFGVFALFTIPFRFIRRSQRKNEAISRAQLRELEEMRRSRDDHS